MKLRNLNLVCYSLILLVTFTHIAAAEQSANNELVIPRFTFDEQMDTPGRTEGTGTFFEVTDSQYLNVTVETDVVVTVTLESVPETVTIHISTKTDADSTLLTITGLLGETTYYMYEDDYHNSYYFITDEYGSFTYSQDISTLHTIFIQPEPTTRFVPSDTEIGTWDPDTRTYTLTTDVDETIQIDEDNLTLDGNGFSIIGSGTGHGIYMPVRTGVTITNLNITDFTDGVYLNNCSQVFIVANNLSNNGHGIYVYAGTENTIEGNICTENIYGLWLRSTRFNEVLANNLSANTAFGMYLYSYCSGNLIANNTITENAQLGIEMNFYCNNNELVCNDISSNDAGIDLYNSSDNTFTGNTLNDNNAFAFFLQYNVSRNNISSNVCSNNFYGVLLGSYCNNNEIYSNNFIDNDTHIQLMSATTSVFNLDAPTGGNYYSDLTGTDDNGDGFIDEPYYIAFDEWDYLPLVSAAPSGCNSAPIANAGSNQFDVAGTAFTLDGSASYDSEDDPLTYYWYFTSVPEGSAAVIDDPTAEVTSFVADLPGQYAFSLIVNDGYEDSEPDDAVFIATSPVVTLKVKIDETIDAISTFDSSVFKNKNSQKTLVNKLNAVIQKIDEQCYDEAREKLQNDLLKKTDGCVLKGAPDKNDWIRSCDEQDQLYNLITEAIELLQLL